MLVPSTGPSDTQRTDAREDRRAEDDRQLAKARQLSADLRAASLVQALLRGRPSARPAPVVGAMAPAHADQGPRTAGSTPGRETGRPQERSTEPAEPHTSQKAADPRVGRRPTEERASSTHAAVPTPSPELAAVPSRAAAAIDGNRTAAPQQARRAELRTEVVEAVVRACRADERSPGDTRMTLEIVPSGGRGGFTMDVATRGEGKVALRFRSGSMPLTTSDVEQVIERLAARGVQVVESSVQGV